MNSTENMALLRKTSKPLIEKRRRERMNNCLDQMKKIVLKATHKGDKVKLEKADIMEMTVRYIEDIQKKQIHQENERAQLAVNSYMQGYSSCMKEVDTVLSAPYVNSDLRSAVSGHLISGLYAMRVQNHDAQTTQTTHEESVQTRLSYPGQERLATSNGQERLATNTGQERLTTSTPHSVLTSDNIPHVQLSPIQGVSARYLPSPNTTLSSSDSHSISPFQQQWHSSSDSSDSGVNNSSYATGVWRPW